MNSNINKDRKCVLTIYFEKGDTLRCHLHTKCMELMKILDLRYIVKWVSDVCKQ